MRRTPGLVARRVDPRRCTLVLLLVDVRVKQLVFVVCVPCLFVALDVANSDGYVFSGKQNKHKAIKPAF